MKEEEETYTHLKAYRKELLDKGKSLKVDANNLGTSIFTGIEAIAIRTTIDLIDALLKDFENENN